MTKPLTDTQRAILRDAAKHADGLALPPPHLPPAPRVAVAKALLGAGLLAHALGDDEKQDPALAWRLDGQGVLLRITEAGLRAIGAAPAAISRGAPQGSVAELGARPSAPAEEGAEVAAAPRRRGAGHGGARGRPGRLRGRCAAARALRPPRRRAGGARRLGRQ
jgi:hypothetical protein